MTEPTNADMCVEQFVKEKILPILPPEKRNHPDVDTMMINIPLGAMKQMMAEFIVYTASKFAEEEELMNERMQQKHLM